MFARGAAAVALWAINPLLSLAATVEPGPGEDANCGAILKEATHPNSDMRGATEAMQKQQEESQKMGGPGGILGALSKKQKKQNEPNIEEPIPGKTR